MTFHNYTVYKPCEDCGESFRGLPRTRFCPECRTVRRAKEKARERKRAAPDAEERK